MSVNDILKRRMRQKCGKVFIGVLSVLLCVCVILTVAFRTPDAEENFVAAGDKTVGVEATQAQREPSARELINATVSLVDELKAILYDIKGGNLENAKRKTDAVVQNIHTIQSSLDKTIHMLGNAFPGVKEQLVNVQNTLSLGEMGIRTLLEPTIDQLQAYPLSELRAAEGISTKCLGHYIDFAEAVMPDVEKCVELANSIDFSLIDRDGKLAAGLEVANRFLEIYREDETILHTIKEMIGAEEDRLYLLAAQNSSEIRASGGFPGSIGTIRIENGVLTLGEFASVYDVLASSILGKTAISAEEHRLFGQLSGISAPRDAVNCPDFERVAYIWSLGYESRQREEIDGVISMTPCIVQRLLSAADEEIVLSDGLVLNGENATKVLQYDLYYKYFGETQVFGAERISDELFADAANQTMQKIMGNMSIANMLDYLSVAEQSFSDRTLMLWMRDETEQNVIRRFGWNCGLNTDPKTPEAGVYFNCIAASKMGWFLVMDSHIGECVINEDGSCTYPITVCLTNAISEAEIKNAGPYILGGNGGVLVGSVYFFAPAGGTVSDFVMSNGGQVLKELYHDLELGFVSNLYLSPQKTVTVTYNITTGPEAEVPLSFSQTPTVQAYHETSGLAS